jgi:allantoinase
VQTIDAAQLQHRNPITPYAGRQLSGVVRSAWLRGVRIDIADAPRGRQLTRGE